jgi:hypothetical protein
MGDRFVRFSVESGRRVAEALGDAGFGRDVIAGVLVGLRRGEAPAQSELGSGGASTESLVPCDTCRDLRDLCETTGDCCNKGSGCTQCTVCR